MINSFIKKAVLDWEGGVAALQGSWAEGLRDQGVKMGESGRNHHACLDAYTTCEGTYYSHGGEKKKSGKYIFSFSPVYILKKTIQDLTQEEMLR